MAFSLTCGFTFLITKWHRYSLAMTTQRWLPTYLNQWPYAVFLSCCSCSRLILEVDGLIWPLQGSISQTQTFFGFKATWWLLNVAPSMKLSWSCVMFRPCGEFWISRSIDLSSPDALRCMGLDVGGEVELGAAIYWLKFQSLFKISAPPTGGALSQMDMNLWFGHSSTNFSVYGIEK